ncbi:protein TAPT1 homolog [Schistocerca piceifrons]|uniref:protein TAPT1 homolog n=1 Tax=Schistocerca piceifrons TaxID=274613 RepID=UPI001F5FACFB|nr:protein TAPT1 homolog [Schistocerca piceifrons]
MPENNKASNVLLERKIRFEQTSKVHYDNENKVEELFFEKDKRYYTGNDHSTGSKEGDKRRGAETVSLLHFLRVELTRGYLLENDEERYSARREKIYSFMKIPREVEKFMAYGFFQCADSFLFVYTFLPLRFILALWSVISRPVRGCFGLKNSKSKKILKPAEICDLLKACILVMCSMIMSYIDTSMMYHLIKSQSVIKLYIFYNMLEVGDRLFSAFGQDTIDALFWTATEPRDRKREHLGVIPHLLFAMVYVLLHSLLVLFQATTLNVAINSNNKALLTIMMSNNFVELKGSVFKKFDKNNLFQVSCSDVRERFHLFVLLFIVVLQTMKEYSWKEERFWVLLPDCMMVLLAEVFVDWIKHAFITRFNELPVDVYKDYTTSLAYDMAETRQKHAFSDPSDLVARRMGFIPLPLGVVMMRVLGHALHIEGPAAFILLLLSYLCLASFRILNSVIMLGKACGLIKQYQQEKVGTPAVSSTVSRATSPINGRPNVARQLLPDGGISASPAHHTLQRSVTVDASSLKQGFGVIEVEKKEPPLQAPSDRSLGPAAIFSNSAVSIDSVCLNEELLRHERSPETGLASIVEHEVLTRSVPNIQANLNVDGASDSLVQDESAAQKSDEFSKKRAESEPSIPSVIDAERASVS